MGKIDRKELQTTAELAALRLSEEELSVLENKLSALLDYCEIVCTVDTSLFYTEDHDTKEEDLGILMTRDDAVQQAESPGSLICAAGDNDGQFAIIPRVF